MNENVDARSADEPNRPRLPPIDESIYAPRPVSPVVGILVTGFAFAAAILLFVAAYHALMGESGFLFGIGGAFFATAGIVISQIANGK